jgi:hypothetical protein
MLMPLMVRLTDSEVGAIESVFPQVPDYLEDGSCAERQRGKRPTPGTVIRRRHVGSGHPVEHALGESLDLPAHHLGDVQQRFSQARQHRVICGQLAHTGREVLAA